MKVILFLVSIALFTACSSLHKDRDLSYQKILDHKKYQNKPNDLFLNDNFSLKKYSKKGSGVLQIIFGEIVKQILITGFKEKLAGKDLYVEKKRTTRELNEFEELLCIYLIRESFLLEEKGSKGIRDIFQLFFIKFLIGFLKAQK
jgi:hypothetical protein